MQYKGWTGFIERRKFNQKLRNFEISSMKCEREFIKLDLQTDYIKKVEPCVYVGKLILGILFIFMSAICVSVFIINITSNVLQKLEELRDEIGLN